MEIVLEKEGPSFQIEFKPLILSSKKHLVTFIINSLLLMRICLNGIAHLRVTGQGNVHLVI